MRLVTIGGYGFDEPRFLAALKQAAVDTFVDVRQRRGMRGSQYAFLTSSRLQQSLRAAGIQYVHLRELAPPDTVRALQKQSDDVRGTTKRGRAELSPAFVNAYRTQILDRFEVSSFSMAIGANAQVVALFCVEGTPEACHRSLVAERIAELTQSTVHHVRP